MRKRHILLPVMVTAFLVIAGYVTENMSGKKFCSVSKNCPLKQKKQVAQPQGSSPDEMHYGGGLNRLIVSTIR